MSVPVEVTVIIVLSVISYLNPRAVRMLGHVIPAIIEFLKSSVRLGILENILCSVRRVIHELINDHHMIISGPDEICRSGVCLPSETAIVLNAGIVSTFSSLCGDEHDSGRCLRTIDGTGRCILKHGYRLDVVRVDLAEAHLYSVRKDQWRSRVQ